MRKTVTQQWEKDMIIREYYNDRMRDWFQAAMFQVVSRIPAKYILCNGQLKSYIPYAYLIRMAQIRMQYRDYLKSTYPILFDKNHA